MNRPPRLSPLLLSGSLVLSFVLCGSISHGGVPTTIPQLPLVDDWTHHHLAFSHPGTMLEALRKGQLELWLKVATDPRYHLQQWKRQAAASHDFHFSPQNNGASEAEEQDQTPVLNPLAHVPPNQLPRGLVRVPAEFRHLAHQHADWYRRRFRVAAQLQTDWSEDMGTGASAGLGVYPAKFSFGITTANCANAANPDYVVYNTGLAGSGTQADILAYDNLYTGCSGMAPQTYWAYNTGGAVVTSPVLALDGSQVAFMQTSGGVASLVLLKWAASSSESAGNPMTLSATSAAMYRSCHAPCMTTITLSGGANDSASSPFYDYSSDSLYVGDDSGALRKFTGIFSGTPAEVSGGGWPASVSTQPLGGPVFDGVSGNVFVGDYLPASEQGSSTCEMAGCGFLYSINSSTGALAGKSNRLDFEFGVADSPLVDSSAQMVYAFAGADGSSACSLGQQCAGVFQFPTGFASGSGTEATVGAGFVFLMTGSFDNAYFTSGNGSSPSGHLYVVGNTGLANNTLYQVSITSNAMSTSAVAGPEIANNFDNELEEAGLPITEFANGAHDYLFLGVLAFGLPTGCDDDSGNGCLLVYDVSSGSISSSTTPSFAAAEAGGISGMVVDNTSSFMGASNVYFTPLKDQPCPTSGGTGGCAIQTSQ